MPVGFRKSDGSCTLPPEQQAQNVLPREVYLANCAKGGRNCGEARRRRRSLRDLAQAILECDLPTDDVIRVALETRGIEATEGAAILFAQLNRAKSGDTEAARFIRDTSGQKPVDGLAIGNLSDKPFETLDLSQLSEEQLRTLAENAQDE